MGTMTNKLPRAGLISCNLGCAILDLAAELGPIGCFLSFDLPRADGDHPGSGRLASLRALQLQLQLHLRCNGVSVVTN